MVCFGLGWGGMKKRWFLAVLCISLFTGCQPGAAEISSQTAEPDITVQPSPTITPELTQTPTIEVCTETRGRFEFQEIQTELMTHPLQFRVYLPPCYDFDSQSRYPVLYYLHGQSFNDDQWDRLGADEALDELIADGEVKPFIIVMPKESNYMIDLSLIHISEPTRPY